TTNTLGALGGALMVALLIFEAPGEGHAVACRRPDGADGRRLRAGGGVRGADAPVPFRSAARHRRRPVRATARRAAVLFPALVRRSAPARRLALRPGRVPGRDDARRAGALHETDVAGGGDCGGRTRARGGTDTRDTRALDPVGGGRHARAGARARRVGGAPPARAADAGAAR